MNDTIRRIQSPERVETWPPTVIFRQNLVYRSGRHCCTDNKTVTLYCRAISDVRARIVIHDRLIESMFKMIQPMLPNVFVSSD